MNGKQNAQLASTIREVFQLTLRRDVVDDEEDFFDMGGDSLLATVAAGCLSDLLAIEIQISDFYAYPTIVSLEQELQTRLSPPAVSTNERGA